MLFVLFCVIFSELKNNRKTTKQKIKQIKHLKTTIKYVKYSKS